MLVCVCVCLVCVCLVCVFWLRSTAFAGGRKNAITQSILVRLGCPLDVGQLLQRVLQSHHCDGVNLNTLKFFFNDFSFPFFSGFPFFHFSFFF